MKHLFTLVLAFTLSLVSFSQNLLQDVDHQVLITPKHHTLKSNIHLVDAFFEFYNVEVVKYFSELNMYVVKTNDYSELADWCAASGLFDNVERDQLHDTKLDYIPNDPEFNQCWQLFQSNDKDIDADEAWDLVPANNPFVSVAMFDGGLDLTHPDLLGNIDSPYNAVNGTSAVPYVNADDKHGTACSGTIAAVTNNGIGVASVGNNKVKVMPICIMSQVFAGGSFNTSSAIQIAAVNAAMANPNCVAIAMSYGGSGYSSTLDAAFLAARTNGRGGKGMMVFASAGNGYSGTAAQYPANYAGVWGVGATTSSDVKAGYSNFGQICDISAPGSSVRTTDRVGTDGYNTTNYTSISGTSFSCPITAAASAFIAYKNWELTDDEILQILSQTCEKVGGYAYANDPAWPYSTRSNELGYGRINLKDAINMTPAPGGTPPPPPAPRHNLLVQSVVATPSVVNLGNNISVTFNAVTDHPELDAVTTHLQYRHSINTIWGDADDVIIGSDSATVGGNVASVSKTFSYNVPGLAGVRYVLVRTNYDNLITEANTTDNTAFTSFTVNDPTFLGTDVKVELTAPTANPWTTSATVVNAQWKLTNIGTTNITQVGYSRGWTVCPPTAFTCVNTITWNGLLLPGQSAILPSGPNSFISINLCHPTGCAVPVGGTNTYRLNIISVNGFVGDGNPTNNRVDLVFNRISTAEEQSMEGNTITDPEKEQPLYTEIYTITGVLLNVNDLSLLPTGLYIIRDVYTDHTITYKKGK